MPKYRNRRIWTVAVAVSILVVAIITVPGTQSIIGFAPNSSQDNWPAQFRSNGERIYFTGVSASGLPVTPTGGGMHIRMHGGGCVSCHGTDRLGGRTMPRFWIKAPPLTPAALFKTDDDHSGDEGHGDHDAYNDETLRRAITDGRDPDNEQLDAAMPRWSMAAQDLADLIGFLRNPVPE